ncbi:hypothetical protein F3Y22_tig00110819pilonHSYRG00250 [Hibiscus syriacus]|uniref:RNase H type-1 domain-containing protein n=1 Tax=Hibiscus syriacus TaxID=106335 RepID=A0A6A2ZQ86_HIBSY|nr:hypothetical protein F3Y22_tig00110819pilonHSYRG00250 [Hibiscus syriacus]
MLLTQALPKNSGNPTEFFNGPEVLCSPQLEGPGSPFPDEDQRVTKKVRNKEDEDDHMEEAQEGIEAQMNKTNAGEDADKQEKLSYAGAVTSQSPRIEDVVSLQAMDEVVSMASVSWTTMAHIRRAIGYKTLLNRIGILWQLQGTMDDFWKLSHSPTMESIVLNNGKTSITVVKIDYNTNSGERGRFARLTILVNLNKPLIPCIKIDGFWQKIEYEGLQQICFHCGVYGHSKESCGHIEGNTSKGKIANVTSVNMEKEFYGEEARYGPWMIAETRRRRTRRNTDSHPKVSGDNVQGSRFAILNDSKNNPVANNTTPTVVIEAEISKSNDPVNTPRMENRGKGKDKTVLGSRGIGNNILENSNNKVVTGDSRALQHINVIEIEVGVIPQGTKTRKITATGNHSTIVISENNRDSLGSKGVRVVTDWMRNINLSPQVNKVTLHGESSSFPYEKEREEALPHTTKGSTSASEEIHVLDGENANPNLPLVLTISSGTLSTLGYPHSFRVEAHGFSGGIWILWEDGLNVKILTISNQFIHGRCWSKNDTRWHYFTVVYASPQVEKRKLIWNHLMNLAPSDTEAWILGGDFNSIFRPKKKESGAIRGSRISALFADFIFKMGLYEVVYRGSKFTWRRGNLCKRITLSLRVFLSEVWSNYLDMLANVNSFQTKAKDWNLKVFGHIERKKRELLAHLRGIDKALLTRYTRRLVELQYRLSYELEEVLQQEESLWLQKSRNQWVLYRDKNTKYFHACTMRRCRHNFIGALKSPNGSWVSDQKALCSMVLNNLSRPLINEEIREVVFNMSPLNAPGVDGLHVFFYQWNWDTLKPMMNQWISENQTSFVPDSSIIGNIIVAQEIVHTMRSKKGELHIPVSIRSLIMRCVTSVLTQRLAHAISIAVENGQWKPIHLCRNGPNLSHLFFADDLVLFAEASIEQCYEVHNLGKYLGVPLLHSRITRASFSYIVSRVRDKLVGWKAKALSLAGRITLAKTVLSTISYFSMQSIKLLKGIYDEVEKLIQGFIWGRTEARGGVSLVNWETMCKPTSKGGIGIKKLYDQNDVFLMKLAFNMIAKADKLWAKVLRSKYKWQSGLPDSIMRKRLCFEANRALASTMSRSQTYRQVNRIVLWSPPPPNWCKMNTDGSRKAGNGFATCGGVLRSSNGDWLVGFSKVIGICSIVEAELWGIYEGLSHAWNRGERQVMVEADSVEVIQMLQRKTKRGSFLSLLDRVLELLNREWNVTLRYVNREANKVADKLARIAAGRGYSQSIFHSPPLEGGSQKVDKFPQKFSFLLELSASNDLVGFKSAIEEGCYDIDEPSLWYGRRIGSTKIGFEERTPLLIASLFGSKDVVNYIVKSGRVDVNQTHGSDGATTLHCAVVGGSFCSAEVVRILLDAAADINSLDANGNRPVDLITSDRNSAFSLRKKILESLLKESTCDGEIEGVRYMAQMSLGCITSKSRLAQGLTLMTGPSALLFIPGKMRGDVILGNTYTVAFLALNFVRIPASRAIIVSSALPSPRSYSAMGSSLDMGSMSLHGLGSPSVLLPSTSTRPLTPTGTGSISSPMAGVMWPNQSNNLSSLELHGLSSTTNWNNPLSTTSTFSASADENGKSNWFGGFSLDASTHQLQSPTGVSYMANLASHSMRASQSYGVDPSRSTASPVLSPSPAPFANRRSSFMEFTSLNHKSGLSSPSAVPSNFSDWGSPDGKLDWGIHRQELNKLTQASCFSFQSSSSYLRDPTQSLSSTSDEPDVSWVQSLEKDKQQLSHHNTDGSAVFPVWVEQYYMEHEKMETQKQS